MNEVTKIHLSRSAFTISVSAKTELKQYLDAIEKHVDKEVLTEIEARMAELLAERGITEEKVVLAEDVSFLKEQLGDPADFVDEEDQPAIKDQPARRLMRVADGRILGGVTTGLGQFFGVDAIWFRLAFIALCFASGFGILLYAVLWIIVPEAKSASDFLQMKGEPVTAEAIKNFYEQSGKTLKKIDVSEPVRTLFKIVKRLVGVGLGVLGVLALVGASLSTAFVLSPPVNAVFPKTAGEMVLFGMYWVVISSFAGLLFLGAGKLWQTRRSKNQATRWSAALLGAAFVISGIVATGLLVPTVDNVSKRWDQQTKRENVVLADTTTPRKLTVHGDSSQRIRVKFVQAAGAVRIEQIHYPGLPKMSVSAINENGELTVVQNKSDGKECGIICRMAPRDNEVVVYSPIPMEVEASNYASVDMRSVSAQSLNLTVSETATISIDGGAISKLTGSARSNGALALQGLTTEETSITSDSTSRVFAPLAKNLQATLPCSLDLSSPILILESYPSETFVLNNEPVSLENTIEMRCLDIWQEHRYDKSIRGDI